MKVAENSIIDLDILPGKGQGDVVGEAKALAENPNIPPEQREKAKGILANMQGVGGGLANTAGGAVKGVVDTAGDTVCLLFLFLFFVFPLTPPIHILQDI
ncbi:MAG: hypothetical protein Q9216_006930 [Gyalolechia sp. 2 TL-2023]